MWQRTDYERESQKIGQDYVNSFSGEKTTINQLATKVARDNNLNPEGIRTVVRLANVAAFEEIFKKQAGDKMIEFEVGDPEIVINNLYQEKSASLTASAQPSSYDFGQDYYGDLNPGTPVTKTAEATTPAQIEELPNVSPQVLKGKLLDAQSKLAMEKKEHEYQWLESMEKASRCFSTTTFDPRACSAFEKDAVAILGDTVVPEIKALRMLSGYEGRQSMFGGTKLAMVLTTHVAVPTENNKRIIELLKVAMDERMKADECKRGLEWIANNITRVK